MALTKHQYLISNYILKLFLSFLCFCIIFGEITHGKSVSRNVVRKSRVQRVETLKDGQNVHEKNIVPKWSEIFESLDLPDKDLTEVHHGKYSVPHPYMVELFNLMRNANRHLAMNSISIRSIQSVYEFSSAQECSLHFHLPPSFATKNITTVELVLSTSNDKKESSISNRSERRLSVDISHQLFYSLNRIVYDNSKEKIHGLHVGKDQNFDVFDVSQLTRTISQTNDTAGNFSLTIELKRNDSIIDCTKQYDMTVGNTSSPILVFYFGDARLVKNIFEQLNVTRRIRNHFGFPLNFDLESTRETTRLSDVSAYSHSWRGQRRRRSIQKSVCRLHRWYVDFDQIGWGKWIFAPAGIHVNYCNGRCPYPLAAFYNATQHAVLRSLYLRKRRVNVNLIKKPSKVCCVAKTFEAQLMLYADNDGMVTVRNWDNIKATSCACL